MWLLFLRGSPRALMTLPKASSPQLIWMLSFSLSPVFPVFTIRSEPARSTKWNLETRTWPEAGTEGWLWRARRVRRPAPRRCSIVTVKMVCERLDCALMWVAPVCLAVLPISSRLSTSSSPSTSDSFTPLSTATANGALAVRDGLPEEGLALLSGA
uniref:Uncharacterized protein n=1 Tax=Anas platyrhynchos platyrhynchos TaxID=8840 RepID=A0A493SYV2_ANAPP